MGEDDPNSPTVMSAGQLVTAVAQTVQMPLAKALWPRLLSLAVICSKCSGEEEEEEKDKYSQSCIYIPVVNGLRGIFIQEIA